jgi:uncharacterized membrane protein
MLSAVVQTQAAIIAIVITLTLIAVQLTASAYSPRVIDIFKKNPGLLVAFLFRLNPVFLWHIGLGHSLSLRCFRICGILPVF